VSCASASSERREIRIVSASIGCVRGDVISARSASAAAVEPYSVRHAESATEPFGVTWHCTVDRPVVNAALRDTFTHVKVALPLPAANRLPIRPPQSELAPSGAETMATLGASASCRTPSSGTEGANAVARATTAPAASLRSY
jgi:hypothetical protein